MALQVLSIDTKRGAEILDEIYGMNELKACPLVNTFKIIGKRWTIQILREMFRGGKQFNRFHENIKGITPKMLSLRLKELENNKIIKRSIVSESPIRVEYELTDLGRELGPLLLQAAAFSMREFPRSIFKDGKPRDPIKILAKSQAVAIR